MAKSRKSPKPHRRHAAGAQAAERRRRSTLLVKRFPPDLYGRCVTFLYVSLEEANAYFVREHKRASADDPHVPLRECCIGHRKVITQDGYEADYIFVRAGSGPITEFAVIAHETLHHVGHALRMGGLPWTEDSEEAYTYYQQFMIKQCLLAIQHRALR